MFMDKGGGVTQAMECLKALGKIGYDISPLDWFSEEIDFEILFLFGFTHFNPQILQYLKEKNVKILVEPIFVRTTKYLYNIIGKYLRYLPFSNTIKVQHQILSLADAVFPNSEMKKKQIHNIYDTP